MGPSQNVKKFLEALFGERTQVMRATTGWREMSPGPKSPETEAILGFVNDLEYNEFHGAKVAKFLWDHLGKDVWGLDFGREYSPVLYLEVKMEAVAEIIKGLKALGADELFADRLSRHVCHEGDFHKSTVHRPKFMVIRAWWD